MAVKTVIFDGQAVADIVVDDTCYAQALGMVGEDVTHAKRRECIAVSKLRQAGLACQAPTSEDHDIRVSIQGVLLLADIKTLYLSYGARHGTVDPSEDVWDSIDHAIAKEDKQGCVCLFDLSYLPTANRQACVGGIHNTYPTAITLEYDRTNTQLHIIRPTSHFHFHRGAPNPARDREWYN